MKTEQLLINYEDYNNSFDDGELVADRMIKEDLQYFMSPQIVS